MKDLPSVSELENLQIAETSKIYDRNGKELYSIFAEKRTYVPFEKISKNVMNGLVAGEDKKFWTNPGVDFVGIFRAGLYFLSGKTDTPKGTSTLTQQLIRNTVIEKKANEGKWEGIERKIKEIYLSYQLTKYGSSKEKIIELYLNKISFGHNAYGIEEAGKTFFNTSAKDLTVLQASILASLPKGPTFYSPYNHPDRVVGNPIIKQKASDKKKVPDNKKEDKKTNKDDKNVKTDAEKNTEIHAETNEGNKETTINLLTKKDLEQHKELVEKLRGFIKNLKGKTISGSEVLPLCGINKKYLTGVYAKQVDRNGCASIPYNNLMAFFGSIEIPKGVQSISYNAGRKDYILQRMLEDEYITFDQYKKAILGGFGLEFYHRSEKIKAPHFVFYVREFLEKKYGVDTVERGGLKVYTTLDIDVQNKAQEIVTAQAKANAGKYNAKNASLVAIDNKTGGILAMVGSADYYNEAIKGQVNVMTSRIQPGSTFKPFVYSLAMEEEGIGNKTPVYDVPTKFPGYKKPPKNFDGKFMGKMTVASALNHSRNIPALKMYFKAGEYKNILKFMKTLGVHSIDEKRPYGAAMALGTAEMTGLELAGAYSVFADMGRQSQITPILKIEDSKGNIIEDNSNPKKIQVIPLGQAFMINNILSDTSARPKFWNQYLDLSDRLVAAKTGTSTKPSKVGDQRPANLWTVGYTPQVTTVVWSGNSDGEDLWRTANGLEASGPIWKNFMEYMHKNKRPVEKWNLPKDVKSIQISSLNGYLPNKHSKYTVSSYFRKAPTKYDKSAGSVEYDALCNGPVTDETPKDAIKTARILEFHSLWPENRAWEDPVQAWAHSSYVINTYGASSGAFLSKKPCVRENGKGNFRLTSSITPIKPYRVGENPISIAYVNDNKVTNLQIYLNGELIKELPADNSTKGGVSTSIFIPGRYKNSTVTLKIRALDSLYYTTSKSYKILVIDAGLKIKDNIELEITQPKDEEELNSNKEKTEEKGTDTKETKEEKTNKQKEKIPPKNISPAASIQVEKPASGSIKIHQEDYFNLRANVSGGATTEIFVDGGLHENLGEASRIVSPINQKAKLSVGKHTVLIRTTDANGKKVEKTINLEILK
ncbi:penicillin-binding protein [Candidatus Gracilibacteria bacterium]|nr:penicillin-binding protein [Candidatus Gracilibacteria bacterium]